MRAAFCSCAASVCQARLRLNSEQRFVNTCLSVASTTSSLPRLVCPAQRERADLFESSQWQHARGNCAGPVPPRVIAAFQMWQPGDVVTQLSGRASDASVWGTRYAFVTYHSLWFTSL